MSKKEINNELQALISLIDEPSENMYDQVRKKILFYGIDAVPFLENAWDNSFDNNIQERIEEIIHNIQQTNLQAELSSWKIKNHLDLCKGFYLVSKYQYPDLREEEMIEKIKLIEKDIWLELNTNLTALEKIKVINHIFFDVHRFSGNKININAPQNMFLSNLLETRKGNHLSIGILYIILARKLGIPVFGVDLPQHFILAYIDEIHEERIASLNENEVLFYINPFNKGAVFTQREIELFVKHLKLAPKDSYYQPCDNITIIKRLLSDMIISYEKMGYLEQVEEVKALLAVL